MKKETVLSVILLVSPSVWASGLFCKVEVEKQKREYWLHSVDSRWHLSMKADDQELSYPLLAIPKISLHRDAFTVTYTSFLGGFTIEIKGSPEIADFWVSTNYELEINDTGYDPQLSSEFDELDTHGPTKASCVVKD